MREGTLQLQSSSGVVLLVVVLLCASSGLCDKEVTHPAVFYKEDYVSADYDPTSANATSSELKPNSLLKSEKLVFDYLPNTNPKEVESKRHGRHHKRNRNYDVALKRSKRQTFNDPHGVFSKQEPKKSNPISTRQRRQYFQQPYQPYNTYNSWGESSAYTGYFATPNVVSFLPAAYNLPSNYYLPVASNNNNHNVKIPIRGIYYNPISVPGNVAAVKPNPPIVSVGNRIGDEPDYFDERPVWGVRYENVRPPSASGSGAFTTRRPTTVSTPPPLLHGRDRQSTPPPLLHNRDNNSVTQRPAATFTTRRPQETPPTTRAPPTPQQLSKCVWAIVSCCSRDNANVRYQCFEQMGCMGAFWGLNPCANDVQDTALDAADRYFD